MCEKTCLGLTALTHPPIPKLPSIPLPSLQTHLNFSYNSPLKTEIPKIPKRFVVFANNDNGLEQDSNSKEKVEEKGKDEGIGSDGSGSVDDLGKNQQPLFGNIRWGDLLPDPDPNNVLAVGFTGLLTWVSVQVLSIASAMLVVVCKYSFIAVVLLFILITFFGSLVFQFYSQTS
ncbi:uncharacterized protein LOC125478344 [Pyrus x bretschneideri]|uniref:uncharacterized protein LOC125478344 n=1 Tax=Pyrus x bretschneideri TaxID=225117 RepID=UPI00202E9F1B|nr:uncharacterized protein LOC125478344 [Pyrus x bretschneideri]